MDYDRPRMFKAARTKKASGTGSNSVSGSAVLMTDYFLGVEFNCTKYSGI